MPRRSHSTVDEMRMGYWDEKRYSDEDLRRTAFEEFVVNFVVAFSGSALLFLVNIM